MEPTSHRRARPLHKYRHGWSHYREHRAGVAHGHRRRPARAHLAPQRTAGESARHLRRTLRGRDPVELLKQFALGTVLAVVIVFVVCLVWGILTILSAKHDLSGAQSEATALAVDRTQLFTAHGREHALHQIEGMQRGAQQAVNLVDNSIPLQVLSWVPFVGQQVQGVHDLVNDFNTTSNQAYTMFSSLNLLLGSSHGTTINLPALALLDDDVHAAARVLKPLNRGSGLLIGPLASARTSFDTEIVKISNLLTVGGNLLDYASPFLGSQGPRTYLVAGENNAEMRDQGAVLSWALLTARDGTFSMTKSKSVGALSIRHPADITLPEGTLDAFGLLQPTRIWQSVNATGDFRLSGEDMAAMYTRRTHRHVNGVIGVDPVMLMHVLEATGGVHIPGVPENKAVTSKNVEYVLMHGLYLLYPHDYQLGRRHDEVAAVAKAAVDKMKRHHYNLAYLVDQLAKAVRGRHLLVWSQYPVLEGAVTRFGASGVLTAHGSDVVHLAIESAVAAKLDWYLHTAAKYHVTIDANGTATIEAQVYVANGAAVDCHPHYVCGPSRPNSTVRGQYVGRLDLWFPAGSIVPGGIDESGLVLGRAEVDVYPKRHKMYLLEAVLPHAVRHGTFSLTFIPQSTIDPELTKVTLSAPSWSVSGPGATTWVANEARGFTWHLSH